MSETSSSSPTVPDPRIPLKTPWVAGLLAFLIPGAGHLYQGRIFKGLIYTVSILGTFFFGASLANGKAVHKVVYNETPRGRIEAGHYTLTLGYLCQLPVGLPALPAMIQHSRFDRSLKQQGLAGPSLEPVSDSFEGVYFGEGGRPLGRVHGDITLKTVQGELGPEQRGAFTGTLLSEEGRPQPVTLNLAGPVRLERAILNEERRLLDCEVVEEQRGRLATIGTLEGFIPRSWINRYQVPLEERQWENLNTLGRRLEIALVYTWIAGLLNLLAIWDAVEGPAYGYGDEEPESGGPGAKKKTDSTAAGNPSPATVNETAAAPGAAPANG